MRLFDLLKKHKKEDAVNSQPSCKETVTENSQPLKSLTPTDSVENIPVPVTKENAVINLRKNIIDRINKIPSTSYLLSTLFYGDIKKCFPDEVIKWDHASFNLNLLNKEIFVELSTYPNQFGVYRDKRFFLPACEFHNKATEFNMSIELQCFETEEDWQSLFDDELETSITKVQQALEEEEKKQKEAKRLSNAIVIPDCFESIKPTMEFDELYISLNQTYGSSFSKLTKNFEKYMLEYYYSAKYSSDTEFSQKELSSIEAAWVEQQVNDCIKNPDKTTWHSMVGLDMMSVKICTKNIPNIEFHNETPLNKFYELDLLLQKLAKYGSFSETNKKNI